MKARELDTKDAGFYAYAAARDASMRNIAQKSHYSEAQCLRAERMRMALETVYSAKKVYINYRSKFIAVKLEFAIARDRKSIAVLEADYAREGISKQISPQGVIYRIPKR